MVPIVPCGNMAIDINTDPSCSSTMDPDMALIRTIGLDDTMAPGGITGHSDLYGFGYSMV